MVSKAKSIRGSVASLDYIQSDKQVGDALILDRNGLAGETSQEMLDEMRFIQQSNRNCEKNCISIVLSPSDEKKFTISELRELAHGHLKNLGLDKNQFLATVHTSTGKPHIHIIANRIDLEGNALNDSFISKKAQESAERLAKERGLFTAREISKQKELDRMPLKKEIAKLYQESKIHSRSFEEFKKNMEASGIKVSETINKQGELQGLRFTDKKSGVNFKASEIHKKVGIKDLLESRIKIEAKLSIPLNNIAKDIALKVVKVIGKSSGIGY